KPYSHNGAIFVDIQPIIPLPEATDYQVKVREKSRKEREATKSSKDLTKFDVTINGVTEPNLAKRQAILRVVRHLCTSGISPEQIADSIPWKTMTRLFKHAEGRLDSATFIAAVAIRAREDGGQF